MARRAMGLHIQGGGANGLAEDYIRRVRPSLVKWMAGTVAPEVLAAARDVGALTLVRVFEEDQSLDRVGEYLAKVEQAILANPGVGVFEVSFNEAHQEPAELERKAAADVLGMKLCERHGKRAAVGCFSVGMPALEAWPLYRPALEYAAAGGHFLALHEYGGGSQGLRWGVTGDGPAARGWAFLRHRRVQDWARSVGCSLPRVLITEAGVDVLAQADRPTRGWRTVGGGYDYAADLRWAAERLGESDLVAGWVDFGWASEDSAWHSFDLSRDPAMLARVADLQASIPEGARAQRPEEVTVQDLGALLAAEFGAGYSDLRSVLPRNPHGPAGDFSRRPLGNIEVLAVHHTAGPRDQPWEAIARAHVGGRGWAGIGYHVGIRQGQVAYLGGAELSRACCLDQNHRVLCVAVTGDYEAEAVTAADADALRRVVAVVQAWARSTLGRPLQVLGHREVQGQATACPGRNLLPLVRDLAKGRPAPAAGPSAAVLTAVDKAHRANGITLNPNAALQRAIRADGLTPTIRELEVVDGGVVWVCQRAENLAGGGAMVYCCRRGDWSNVVKLPA